MTTSTLGKTIGVVCLMMLCGAPVAHASLTGDTIFSKLEFPDLFPGFNLWRGFDPPLASDPLEALVTAEDIEYLVFAPGDAVVADFDQDEFAIGIFDAEGQDISRIIFRFWDLDSVDIPGGGRIDTVVLESSTFTDLTFDWTSDSINIFLPEQLLDSDGEIARFRITHVPEPGSLLLLGLGAVALWSRRRGRREPC